MKTTSIEDFEGTPSADCPFCGETFWVGSTEDGCQHLFATGDYLGGSEAWSRLDDDMEEETRDVLDAFLGRKPMEQKVIIEKVGGEAGETLNAMRNSQLWWTNFVEGEVFEAEVDEPTFSTTYYTVLVPDEEVALKILGHRCLEAARALEGPMQ